LVPAHSTSEQAVADGDESQKELHGDQRRDRTADGQVEQQGGSNHHEREQGELVDVRNAELARHDLPRTYAE
jgi:hypothetical protein